MGKRGPEPVSAREVYIFASQFYWDLLALSEGYARWIIDRERYQRLKRVHFSEFLNDDDMTYFQKREEQIQAARLTEAEKKDRLQRIENDLTMTADLRREEQAETKTNVPGQPSVITALLNARTPDAVREICRGAFSFKLVEILDPVTLKPVGQRQIQVAIWPISAGSTLPEYLAQYAEQFISARQHPRFPRSNRPTNRKKQLWFLARALAGALFGLETRTAINIIGSKTPDDSFEESHGAKAARKLN